MDQESRQLLEQIAAKQDEMLQYLKEEGAKSKKIREEAIALQKRAMENAKRIGVFAFTGILLCIALIVYLSAKYRILF